MKFHYYNETLYLHSVNYPKMKNLIVALLFLPAIITFNGCQQTTPEVTAIPLSEYRLMTPAYYRNNQDGSSIQVRFYESQRIYDLQKSSPDFSEAKNLLDAAIINHTPLRIVADDSQLPFGSLSAVQAASTGNLQKAWRRRDP